MADIEIKNSENSREECVSKDSTKKSFFEKLRGFFSKRINVVEKTKNQLTRLDPAAQISQIEVEQKSQSYFPHAESHEWDNNPDFFREQNGYKKKRLSDKIELIRDVGLTFYVVQSGDTIWGIRQKLSRFSEFKYLARPEYKRKMYGFNIRPRDLDAGMLIPIPIESRERRLTDEQFANYCQKAIEEMKIDPIYCEKLRRLLKKFSEKILVELMIAVAKQESGGKPLGQFEFHR